jgi:4'-phosphopantetheinyl transferase
MKNDFQASLSSTVITWQPPPERLKLAQGELHIWRATLDCPENLLPNVLNTPELQRGQRFLREEHRRRFCLASSCLRRILARYTHVPAAQIEFREGPHGKLALTDNSIQFNLSHSQDLALYVVALNQEVGIDIEWLNPDVAIENIAAHYFSSAENSHITSLPTKQRLTAFYYYWTRKEAYLKALGVGLSGLSLLPADNDRMNVQSLSAAPEFAAAVAVAGQHDIKNARISYFTY